MILRANIKLMDGWEVQWVPFVPKKGDEWDLDNANNRRARFKTKEEAVVKAAEVAKDDFFGSARIYQFEHVPCEYELGYFDIEYGEMDSEILASELQEVK